MLIGNGSGGSVGLCSVCGGPVAGVGAILRVCPECVRDRWEESRGPIGAVHAASRTRFGLPVEPPKSAAGVRCGLCLHDCRLDRDDVGYCGIHGGDAATLCRNGRELALVGWYHDPLPTNCVADWVCAGGTGAGFPLYARDPGPEVGFYNLAVFFEACNFNCL